MAAADTTRTYEHPVEEGDEYPTMTGSQLRKRFTDAYQAQDEWRNGVVENLQMLNNDQWTPAQKAQLNEQGMAAMVINKMLMPIMFLAGVQRQTREEPKLLPFEEGDARSTDIMNTLLHWVDEDNNADEIDSRIFIDKVAIGMGWWKVTWDFSGPEPEGCLRRMRRHPLAIFPDPNWFDEGDWRKAEYVFDALWFTPQEAAERWPKHADRFKR